jgi:hypothetical protein
MALLFILLKVHVRQLYRSLQCRKSKQVYLEVQAVIPKLHGVSDEHT